MKKRNILGWMVCWGLYACSAPEDHLTLKTDTFILQVDHTGNVVAMSDNLSGNNHLYSHEKSPLLSIGFGGEVYLPEEARVNQEENEIVLDYGDIGIDVTLHYEEKDTHINFELVGLSPDQKLDHVIWGPFQTTLGKVV